MEDMSAKLTFLTTDHQSEIKGNLLDTLNVNSFQK